MEELKTLIKHNLGTIRKPAHNKQEWKTLLLPYMPAGNSAYGK